jgi:hypothetical protein
VLEVIVAKIDITSNVSAVLTGGGLYVARDARVSETTAREHLEQLVNLNVLLKTERDGGVLYSPDPLHTWM